MDDESRIAEKFKALRGVMHEQMRRLWAATKARALGYEGVSVVARAGRSGASDDHGRNEGVGRCETTRARNIVCGAKVRAGRGSRMANATGLKISVYFPRGTSKWNKIEHRM